MIQQALAVVLSRDTPRSSSFEECESSFDWVLNLYKATPTVKRQIRTPSTAVFYFISPYIDRVGDSVRDTENRSAFEPPSTGALSEAKRPWAVRRPTARQAAVPRERRTMRDRCSVASGVGMLQMGWPRMRPAPALGLHLLALMLLLGVGASPDCGDLSNLLTE
jgi:hypothetical protein